MTRDHADSVSLARSRTVRLVLLGTGHVFVAIAVIGVFLPVLPTTGPLLIAAACYARASDRFYAWLLNHRTFGPVIRDWRHHRTMAKRHKVVAITLIVLTIGSSVVFFVPQLPIRLVLVVIALVLIGFLLRIPTKRVPV